MVEISPISSGASSPELQRRKSRQDSIASSPQTQFLQKTKDLREQQMSSSTNTLNTSQAQNSTIYTPDKPPIPPRGLPPPVPQRQISTSSETVQLRNRGTTSDFEDGGSNDQWNSQKLKMGKFYWKIVNGNIYLRLQIPSLTTKIIKPNYILEPPPLPATLPPVGSQIKQTRISTTTVSYSTSESNINNNSDGATKSTLSWHSQTQSLGSNNNVENVLSNQTLANNNFLDNERAASSIAAG